MLNEMSKSNRKQHRAATGGTVDRRIYFLDAGRIGVADLGGLDGFSSFLFVIKIYFFFFFFLHIFKLLKSVKHYSLLLRNEGKCRSFNFSST